MERKRGSGFRRIFTAAFLLFLTPAGPVSQLYRAIINNSQINKRYCENTTKPATSFSFHDPNFYSLLAIIRCLNPKDELNEILQILVVFIWLQNCLALKLKKNKTLYTLLEVSRVALNFCF